MAGTGAARRRWDTDERFSGVADASGFAAAVDELAALARRPGWVAEEPEAHLVPHGHTIRLRVLPPAAPSRAG